MTENKRFTKYVPDSYGYTYITTIIDNEKKKETGNVDEIVDMLNKLNNENERLQKENDKFVDVIARVQQREFLTRKENEKLRQQLQSILKLTRKIEDYAHDIKMIGDVE